MPCGVGLGSTGMNHVKSLDLIFPSSLLFFLFSLDFLSNELESRWGCLGRHLPLFVVSV